MQQYSITRVRIYDHDTSVIQAFGSTQIRVIIAVTNAEIPSIASTQSNADSWVSTYVAPFIKGTNINAIAVGNEVLTSNSSVSAMLLPAMQNIHTALQSQGFDASVKVSSPHGLGLLEVSYPPSSGVFFTNIVSVMQPLLDFLNTTGSFFMLNVYPFLAYENSVSTVSLGYALFNSSSPVTDSNNGLIYYNLYDAQIDALVSAMGKLNHGSLGVMVTETGWPSDGDPSYEPAANFANAEMYNQNLVKRTMNNSGTPLRPNQEIDSYIVSLYDEDLRPVPSASNRHWGLFYPNGTFKYDFNFLNGNSGGSSSGGGGTNGSNNGTSPPPPPGTTPSSSSQNVWCVAKQGSSNASLQQVRITRTSRSICQYWHHIDSITPNYTIWISVYRIQESNFNPYILIVARSKTMNCELRQCWINAVQKLNP